MTSSSSSSGGGGSISISAKGLTYESARTYLLDTFLQALLTQQQSVSSSTSSAASSSSAIRGVCGTGKPVNQYVSSSDCAVTACAYAASLCASLTVYCAAPNAQAVDADSLIQSSAGVAGIALPHTHTLNTDFTADKSDSSSPSVGLKTPAAAAAAAAPPISNSLVSEPDALSHLRHLRRCVALTTSTEWVDCVAPYIGAMQLRGSGSGSGKTMTSSSSSSSSDSGGGGGGGGGGGMTTIVSGTVRHVSQGASVEGQIETLTLTPAGKTDTFIAGKAAQQQCIQDTEKRKEKENNSKKELSKEDALAQALAECLPSLDEDTRAYCATLLLEAGTSSSERKEVLTAFIEGQGLALNEGSASSAQAQAQAVEELSERLCSVLLGTAGAGLDFADSKEDPYAVCAIAHSAVVSGSVAVSQSASPSADSTTGPVDLDQMLPEGKTEAYAHTQTHTHTHIYIYVRIYIYAHTPQARTNPTAHCPCSLPHTHHSLCATREQHGPQ